MNYLTNIYRVLFVVFSVIATYYFFVPIDNVGPGIPHFDKVGHFVVFFVLAHLFSFSISENVKGLLMVALIYGSAIELIQGTLPHRSASFPDLIADMAGVLFYILIHPKITPLFTGNGK